MSHADLLARLLPPVSYDPSAPHIAVELAAEGAALDAALENADILLDALSPLGAVDLVIDYERTYALTPAPGATLQARQRAVLAKMAEVGGLSRDYFIQLAGALGYQIRITEYKPFRAGSRAGDILSNEQDWLFTWRVGTTETTYTYFVAGISLAGEPLRSWGNDALEALIDDLKPAHTHVLFAYGEIEAQEAFEAADRLFYFANYTMPTQAGVIE